MSLSQLPLEAQLLIRCSSDRDAEHRLDRPVVERVDWPLLHRLAEREQAAPRLWEYLQHATSSLPPEASHIQALARVTSFRMLYLEQRLRDTVGALSAAGVECVLLKGAAIATSVYGSFEARPMLDLDILIPAGRVQEGIAAAISAGWVWPADAGKSAGLHHVPAMPDGSGVAVNLELHTDAVAPGHPFAQYQEALVGGARPLDGPLQGASVPDPLHLLLHACIHFTWSHALRKGAWRTFRDVQTLMARSELDWEQFINLATELRAGTCCYWTFRLAHCLAGVSVPTWVMSRLRPRRSEHVLRLLERHLISVLLPTGVDCPSVTLRRFMWSAAIQPRRSGHGHARPWRTERSEPDLPATAALLPIPSPAPHRATRRHERAQAWLRYVRTLAQLT